MCQNLVTMERRPRRLGAERKKERKKSTTPAKQKSEKEGGEREERGRGKGRRGCDIFVTALLMSGC